MRKILVLATALSAFCAQSVFAAAPNPEDFPFEKQVIFPKVNVETEVKVDFDKKILGQANEKFSNFNLYDSNNDEVPFSIYYEEPSLITKPKAVEVSSTKDGEMQNLVDRDITSKFVFDEKVDKANPSWVLIDLGVTRPINRAKMFLGHNARVRYVEIRGGLDKDNMKTILSKRSFALQSEFSSDLVRFIKVSFWGVGVKIDDMKFYASRNGSFYFNAE
ncbi:MAG: hypothetical protein OEL87_03765, partial [Nanoarchaeota archaeon]|nr:hypothetical protein [Nanoarchaeota archaeon]